MDRFTGIGCKIDRNLPTQFFRDENIVDFSLVGPKISLPMARIDN